MYIMYRTIRLTIETFINSFVNNLQMISKIIDEVTEAKKSAQSFLVTRTSILSKTSL